MKPQKYCALVRNREEPKNGISGTARNREELFARNRDFVGCTIFAVSCGLHSFVLSKTKIFTDMTEDKDLTRCGNNHGTTIGTDRTNGTSLPATADLPPVVRELVDGAPEKFRMPTFIACMAPWGCLATRAVRRVQPRDASGGHRVDGAVHRLHGVPQQMEREGQEFRCICKDNNVGRPVQMNQGTGTFLSRLL